MKKNAPQSWRHEIDSEGEKPMSCFARRPRGVWFAAQGEGSGDERGLL